MGVPRGTALRLLLLALWFMVLTAAGAATAADLPSPSVRPVLNGTFIQLLAEHNSWSRERWQKLFHSFEALGLTQIVVQWSQHDQLPFYGDVESQQTPSAIGTILELAQSRGIEVYLGLAADSRYWEAIQRPAAGQEEYLRRLRWKSERVARELAALAGRYRSFKGWYIVEEIDDLNWRPPASRQALYRHLKQLSSFLKTLTPGGQVLLSAFCQARMDPEAYREFWRDLLRESSVDLLLFQDGAGVGKLPRDLLPLYLKAVRGATDASGRKLQVVVELFHMVSEAPFQAVPAPMARVREQLRVAGEFASGGINSFSVPNYMAPEESAAARELYLGYLQYKGGR